MGAYSLPWRLAAGAPPKSKAKKPHIPKRILTLLEYFVMLLGDLSLRSLGNTMEADTYDSGGEFLQ